MVRCCCLGLLLCLYLWMPPAWAAIHVYHEQPGQTTLRSQLSLPDRQARAWQATVFKRYVNQQLIGIYLRLVAFPGQVAIDPDRPLTIETGTSLRWQAAVDRTALPPNPPDNVVQYDLQAVLTDLVATLPLTLDVPLDNGQVASLVAAPFVVNEWRQITMMEEEPQ